MTQTDVVAPLATTTVPVGTVIAFVLLPANIPANWMVCDGSAIDAKYPLAAFMTNTPNLCGSTLIGAGTAPSHTTYPLLSKGGEETHTLTVAEMPSHAHNYSYSNPIGASGLYGGSYWGPADVTTQTATTGGNGPHNNMQPYVAVSYIIYAGAPG